MSQYQRPLRVPIKLSAIEEDIFVFGYASKIFKDDEKAKYIDHGKHLIPCLSDASIKVDRYDCRGVLPDLAKYVRHDDGGWLTSEEQRVEQLCDAERYRALHNDESEQVLHQEEELKRLKRALDSDAATYSQVGFNYEDVQNNVDETEKQTYGPEGEEEEVFVPPPLLEVPANMKIPDTKKLAGVIQKTVQFIISQGLQMEVLIKMKQANNPLFRFLSFEDELYPYYKFLMEAIKSKRYNPHYKPPQQNPESEQNGINYETHYNLPYVSCVNQDVNQPEPELSIPNIAYTTKKDTAYSALVDKIRESQSTSSALSELLSKTAKLKSMRIKRDIAEEKQNCDLTVAPAVVQPCAAPSPEPLKISDLPLSEMTKSARRRKIKRIKQKEAESEFKIYYAEEKMENNEQDIADAPADSHSEGKDVSSRTRPEHAVETQREDSSPGFEIIIPPPDLQVIIDKSASYVAKNGRDFENIIKLKNDERFTFLEPSHQYHNYYLSKLQQYTPAVTQNLLTPPPVRKSSPVTNEVLANSASRRSYSPPQSDYEDSDSDSSNTKVDSDQSGRSSTRGKIAPVSFHLKKGKEAEPREWKSALPYEESEGSENEKEKSESQNEERKEGEECYTPEFPSLIDDIEEVGEEEESGSQQEKVESLMNPEVWARERLKDKIVMTAKEKLAAKERLQEERKQKAADFLTRLQQEHSGDAPSTPSSEGSKEQPVVEEDEGEKDDDVEIVEDVIVILSDSTDEGDAGRDATEIEGNYLKRRTLLKRMKRKNYISDSTSEEEMRTHRKRKKRIRHSTSDDEKTHRRRKNYISDSTSEEEERTQRKRKKRKKDSDRNEREKDRYHRTHKSSRRLDRRKRESSESSSLGTDDDERSIGRKKKYKKKDKKEKKKGKKAEKSPKRKHHSKSERKKKKKRKTSDLSDDSTG